MLINCIANDDPICEHQGYDIDAGHRDYTSNGDIELAVQFIRQKAGL